MGQKKRRKSRSDVQEYIEKRVIQKLSKELNIKLERHELSLSSEGSMILDGYYKSTKKLERESRYVLAESWAHVGKAKSAQTKKVLTDVLKLAFATKYLREKDTDAKIDAYMVFVNEEASKILTGNGWGALAAKSFGIKSRIVKLPKKCIERITATQKDQDLQNG